ncbi:MAG: cation:dicarboxylase symporter family transporter, partial [Desulfovibrionaceae bacterium]|nr:cation:dicarboxylase symporter family transporter [Desulfovibrionaceae bacterium]
MDNQEKIRELSKKSLDANASKNLNRVLAWFLAMLIGAILGMLGIPTINELCDFVAKVFTRLFQFVAVPVICLAVITTLAELGAKRETGKIFFHAIVYTLSTTFAAALVALLLFLIIAPENVATNAQATVPENLHALSYYQHILSVIPSNVLQPFLAGNVLSILLIAASVGLALAFMPATDSRGTLIRLFTGLQDLFFSLIRALLFILPVGILAFTSQLVSQIEAGVIV